MNTLAVFHGDVGGAQDFPASTRALLALREQLVIEHPINSRLQADVASLLAFFELYAYFVYDFTPYVSALFAGLSDREAKAHIYDNLLDEIGCQTGTAPHWERHHGELYRDFLASLRRTPLYRDTIAPAHGRALECRSQELAQHFYDGHREILRAGDDCASVAAFSAIEGWVVAEYGMWRDTLRRLGDALRFVDMRSIDLHCECDVEHSRVVDRVIARFARATHRAAAIHQINSGLLRGIALSVGLFDSIAHALDAPRQPA